LWAQCCWKGIQLGRPSPNRPDENGLLPPHVNLRANPFQR
jgi:hypothetical protein